MKNRKGFNLVELLVTIAILGIIIGMSIPLVRNIQRQLESRKYETYGKAMLSSAKVYQNDYNVDLFGQHNSGCASVTLNELIRKGLIKDFPDKKISCREANGKTKVSIVKVGKQYGYSYELYCGNRGDDSSFKKVRSLNSKRVATCNGGASSVTVDVVNKNFDLSESHSEKIKITSATGINFNTLSISYSWVASDTIPVNEEDVSKLDIAWKTLAFGNNISESKQKDIIFNKGKSVSMTSEEVTTTKGKAENYVLVLRINSLKNLALDDLEVEEAIASNYKAFGIYEVGQTYQVTYDSNGGSTCSPSFISVLQNKAQNITLNDVKLCAPEKKDNVFNGWNTKKDGTGESISSSIKIIKDTTVYAQWVPSTAPKITFKIQLDNGDKFTQKTTSDSGNKYTWGKNGNILTRKVNDGKVADYTYEIAKGKNVMMDLPNYNNTKYINIFKDYNVADGDVAWKCVSGCKKANQLLSHNSVVIEDTLKIFNSDTVIIKVNWRSTQAKLRYKLFTKDYKPYEKLSVSIGGTLNKDGYLVDRYGNVDFQKISYDGSITDSSEYGILNYNNEGFIKITRDYHTAVRGEEWKCISGDCTKGTKYSQVKTNYKATDFCSDSILKVRDCTANLAVNWRSTRVNIRFKVFTKDYAPYEKLSVDTGGTLNSYDYLVNNSGDVDFQKIPYGTSLIDNYPKGILDYNNKDYIKITRDYHTAVSGEEWKCVSGDCTQGKKYDQANANYKIADFCTESILKTRDCIANLAVNWRKNKIIINYHMNGGKFKAQNSNQENTSNNWAGVSGDYITGGNDKNGKGGSKDFSYNYDSDINDSINHGLLDVKNRFFAYIEHDDKSLTPAKDGFTWSCNKDGSEPYFNQCYPTYEYTNHAKCPSSPIQNGCPYVARDTTGLTHPQCNGSYSDKGPYTPSYIVGKCNSSCSLVNSDCRVTLYVRWVKK